MDVFKANWEWIATNPWGFTTMAILFLGLGWGAAKLFYSERMELLKSQASSKAPPTPAPAKSDTQPYRFAPAGRYGRNLLGATTHRVVVGERVSLKVEMPEDGMLRVELLGSPPTTLDEQSYGWTFDAFSTVWEHEPYQHDSHRQGLVAAGGNGDLGFQFCRAASVTIEVYEGEVRVPTWTKQIQVVAP
jgi:hypothetical protein